MIPTYITFLRLIYHLLLWGVIILIVLLLGLRFLGTQYNADQTYKKLWGITQDHPTLHFVTFKAKINGISQIENKNKVLPSSYVYVKLLVSVD